MALGTGQRNISAALVVAGQNFKDPEIMVPLIVTAVVGLLILMSAAVLMKKGN
jgi:BASS family bile acid:Na+ symporter